MLLLRLWLGMRAFQTGLEKFSGKQMGEVPTEVAGKANTDGLTSTSSVKEYALSHSHGIPESQVKLFEGQPLIPDFALTLFDTTLGPLLIIIGVTTLLGIATRTSLLAMGLLYTALTWGMILMGGAQAAVGVAALGTHMVLIVGALLLLKYNKFTLLKKW